VNQLFDTWPMVTGMVVKHAYYFLTVSEREGSSGAK
jgi:hypothetical protein